ncbi:hypothetical protein BU14_0220s0004 [Porphyra umbilicalis]|uniref:Mur ligase central domain-containing protein n=1 Tax=Porphyra umbilicalis TaxID=2786 RepID=A0A1X6P557_PORUM|nr:hypothetical protein BU14_0220s0004 [Porphyra umbilicalis]|eukprot:OSX75773.1 hypothetical protein BU14_0220s0004 [Porphyra umbilicalis]
MQVRQVGLARCHTLLPAAQPWLPYHAWPAPLKLCILTPVILAAGAPPPPPLARPQPPDAPAHHAVGRLFPRRRPPYGRRLAAALARLDALIDWERSARVVGARRKMRVSAAPCGDLLARLGSPQAALPVTVHITGSKGKGTVAALTAAALTAAGYRTGVYGSPHVTTVTERVRIDGVPVAEEALAAALEAALDARAAAVADRGRAAAAGGGGGGGAAPDAPAVVGNGGGGGGGGGGGDGDGGDSGDSVAGRVDAAADATWFDVMTAAGFLTLATAGVDAAAVEVGLGGALDSTNVLAAPVAVLTNVYSEHAEIIGPTRVDIATEKAGIVARDGRLITGVPPGSAVAAAIERVARARAAAGVTYVCLDGDDLSVEERNAALAGEVLDELGRNGLAVRRPTGAPAANAGGGGGGGGGTPPPVSHRLLDAPGVRAAAAAALPGRMELFAVPPPPSTGAPPVWVAIDGAHVPASAAAAAAALADRVAAGAGRGGGAAPPPAHATTIVLGVGADKDAAGIAGALVAALPAVDRFVCTAVGGEDVYLCPSALAAAVRALPCVGGAGVAVETAADPAAALDVALAAARGGGGGGGGGGRSWVLVIGSLHLAGALRPAVVAMASPGGGGVAAAKG